MFCLQPRWSAHPCQPGIFNQSRLGPWTTNSPPQLYHGTATRFLDSIRQQGLLARGRDYVHLSADEETAVRVGQRHGQPVVLIVRAENMHQASHSFYRSANEVWLVEQVPVNQIAFPDRRERPF